MKKYGCLQAILKSFYSADLYRDVAQNWRGGVLLYLLLVLAICWACMLVTIQKTIDIQYGLFSEQVFPQLPEMTLKNGELTTQENKPYFIVDSHKNIMAIIDVSGKYQDLNNTPAEMLITKKAVIYKGKSKESKSHEFSSGLNLEIKPAIVKEQLQVVFHWLWLVLFPLLLLGSFIYRVIQAALYAVIGEMFALIGHAHLTYGQIFRLAIFAMTPAIIIGTVLDWFGVVLPHLWLFYFILSMGYLIFAIRSNKQ